jgi:folate-binding protein YgfZ
MRREIRFDCIGSSGVFKIYHFICNELVTATLSAITNSTSPAIFWWRPTAWLRVGGADATSFLQGQFTNDLRLAPAVYGLWLTVKGKVVADSFVVRSHVAGEFWVGSYASPASEIQARLESHIIADDVTVEDLTPSWAAVSVFGAPVAGSTDIGEDRVVFPGRRSAVSNEEWVFPATAAEQVRAKLAGARELTAAEVERGRIEAGIPSVPCDIGPADLPNEGGLDATAISYTKGCYLGQEVMARLKSMGQVRRRLLRVASAETLPAVRPAALFLGGRRVGELRSAVALPAGGFTGLAMLSLAPLGAGASLALAPEGPGTVQLRDTP